MLQLKNVAHLQGIPIVPLDVASTRFVTIVPNDSDDVDEVLLSPSSPNHYLDPPDLTQYQTLSRRQISKKKWFSHMAYSRLLRCQPASGQFGVILYEKMEHGVTL